RSTGTRAARITSGRTSANGCASTWGTERPRRTEHLSGRHHLREALHEAAAGGRRRLLGGDDPSGGRVAPVERVRGVVHEQHSVPEVPADTRGGLAAQVGLDPADDDLAVPVLAQPAV